MRKIKIIIIVLVVCLAIGLTFNFVFFAIGKLVQYKSNFMIEEKNEGSIYKNNLDRDRNEKEPEIDYLIGTQIIHYRNQYEGKIEKIEDNKIYFMVNKKGKRTGFGIFYLDVEDYRLVFDIYDYKLEYDPLDKDYSVTVGEDNESLLIFQPIYYDGDYLTYDFKNYYGADELEFLVGEYLRVHDSIIEDTGRGITNKFISFHKN